MNNKERNKRQGIILPELLAPAGNYEKLVTAVHYGADAVYLGGKNFSLRAKAGNFSEEVMAEGVTFAHEHGVKVYVTVNIFAHNKDLQGLDAYLVQLSKMGIDGVIVADPGILQYARKYVPELAVHLSTQANVTNYASAQFWHNQGVGRLNLARELSLVEINDIRKNTDCELEVFVHGALCISYSGRCMLSNYMTGRDANQGSCAHPCRFSYSLVEEKRQGEYYPVEEDERGTYIFNSKDLCLLEQLPQLVHAGVDSLKIEGRMKSIFYVGAVVRIYRAALDYLAALPHDEWLNVEKIQIPESLVEEVVKTGTRGATENFIKGHPGSSEMLYYDSRADQAYEPVAVVRDPQHDGIVVDIRNTLFPGEAVEYMGRGSETKPCSIVRIVDEDGNDIKKAHPGNRLIIMVEPSINSIETHGIFRRVRSTDKQKKS